MAERRGDEATKRRSDEGRGRNAVRPRLAVYKFSSCDGCQLQLLNLEDELLELVEAVEVGRFLEASSQVLPPPYAVGLVEGSISTPEEEKRIREVRRECKFLVAIGACATSGGIQALRNWAEIGEYMGQVYASPEHIQTLETATPIASHVFVDYELRGCPVNGRQLLELISALLAGRKPNIGSYSVCLECKRRGVGCVMVSRGEPCLGPVTHAGCGAICPAYGRGCYGCYGPMEQPNMASLCKRLEQLGYQAGEIKRMLRLFNGYLEPFKQTSDSYERREHE